MFLRRRAAASEGSIGLSDQPDAEGEISGNKIAPTGADGSRREFNCLANCARERERIEVCPVLARAESADANSPLWSRTARLGNIRPSAGNARSVSSRTDTTVGTPRACKRPSTMTRSLAMRAVWGELNACARSVVLPAFLSPDRTIARPRNTNAAAWRSSVSFCGDVRSMANSRTTRISPMRAGRSCGRETTST